MKLQHYLGGLEGLGPVSTETRVFVEPWEKRIFGIHTSMMALSNHLDGASHLDEGDKHSSFDSHWTWAHLRTGAEGMNPFDYFKYRYYEKWLGGISSFFIDEGYITQAELDELTEQYLADEAAELPVSTDDQTDTRIQQYLIHGDSPQQSSGLPVRFTEGQEVSIKNPPTLEHSRLPGFLRNQQGTVDHVYEGRYGYLVNVKADEIGPPMPVYCVRFDPKTLWPGNTEDNFYLYADLYQAYIQ